MSNENTTPPLFALTPGQLSALTAYRDAGQYPEAYRYLEGVVRICRFEGRLAIARPQEKTMYLGIDPQTGLIYEGSGNPDLPALPLPTVTQAKLIEKPEDWNSLPGGLASDPFKWVFREDSFDASTRIRRGRLYQSYGGSQPSTHHVARHP